MKIASIVLLLVPATSGDPKSSAAPDDGCKNEFNAISAACGETAESLEACFDACLKDYAQEHEWKSEPGCDDMEDAFCACGGECAEQANVTEGCAAAGVAFLQCELTEKECPPTECFGQLSFGLKGAAALN
mmetsp:Transcript_32177/g.77820  ORF Transcript_32177/g.77820 Transcript_32177/m.77820 type:complete len:131 (+) Transcript_32177:308-700(+)